MRCVDPDAALWQADVELPANFAEQIGVAAPTPAQFNPVHEDPEVLEALAAFALAPSRADGRPHDLKPAVFTDSVVCAVALCTALEAMYDAPPDLPFGEIDAVLTRFLTLPDTARAMARIAGHLLNHDTMDAVQIDDALHIAPAAVVESNSTHH
jgi:hypothetical protein